MTPPRRVSGHALAVGEVKKMLRMVEQLNEAARVARSWTQPSSCNPSKEMPCRCAHCIKAAETYSYEFARRAAHIANVISVRLSGRSRRVVPSTREGEQ